MDKQLLTEAVREDFKGVREVLVAFADDWHLVKRIYFPFSETESRVVYVATDTPEAQRHGWNPGGLPSEWKSDFEWYRLFKFYEAWPQWILNVKMYGTRRKDGQIGEVEGLHDLDITLRECGSAQVWYGAGRAVLWECLAYNEWADYEALRDFWMAVEGDIEAETFYTHSHDPAYPEGYEEFLSSVGYAPSLYTSWWAKTRGQG